MLKRSSPDPLHRRSRGPLSIPAPLRWAARFARRLLDVDPIVPRPLHRRSRGPRRSPLRSSKNFDESAIAKRRQAVCERLTCGRSREAVGKLPRQRLALRRTPQAPRGINMCMISRDRTPAAPGSSTDPVGGRASSMRRHCARGRSPIPRDRTDCRSGDGQPARGHRTSQRGR